PTHAEPPPARILAEGQPPVHPVVLGCDPGAQRTRVLRARRHHDPSSQPGTSAIDPRTTSGEPFARSSSRNFPVRTRTPVSPAARAPSTSFVMSSPTMAARAAGTPRGPSAASKYAAAGLPQIVAVVSAAASNPAM